MTGINIKIDDQLISGMVRICLYSGAKYSKFYIGAISAGYNGF